jgi:hypothetical protein
MEFVDGETLQALIRRRVRMDVDLSLEILTQVTVGVTEEQRHRPIKIRSSVATQATDWLHYLTSHSCFQR